ncbi:unnamed protein product [Orchesella dallaii]|uniref:Uncharacterized protein n=1 Tax=Orchesella dallaii TaxID=48710 RepID=A0ABP1QJL2_9HEXA
MESRRRTGTDFARPRVGAQRNRGLRGRLFSPRGSSQVVVGRRRVPLQRTPHIPNASDFFRNVHEDDYEVINEVVEEVAEQSGMIGIQDVPEEELDRAGDQTTAREMVTRKRRRRRVVVPTGISSRPNLKKALVTANEFIKKAELDVREIYVHHICATKKRFGWNKIIEKAQTLLCTLAKASNVKGLSKRELSSFEKLEIVNERVKKLVSKFEEELESQRKALKLARVVGTRKRSCCMVCHESNKVVPVPTIITFADTLKLEVYVIGEVLEVLCKEVRGQIKIKGSFTIVENKMKNYLLSCEFGLGHETRLSWVPDCRLTNKIAEKQQHLHKSKDYDPKVVITLQVTLDELLSITKDLCRNLLTEGNVPVHSLASLKTVLLEKVAESFNIDDLRVHYLMPYHDK